MSIPKGFPPLDQLNTPGGQKRFNGWLQGKAFCTGFQPTALDKTVFELIGIFTDKSCPHCVEELDSAKALIEISVDALNGLSEEAEEWEELEFMVDSGAGATVIGREHAKAVQASDPDPTAKYKLAVGSIIHNQGRKTFVAATEDWDLRKIGASVTKVDTPLLSVSAIVLAGGTVVFSPREAGALLSGGKESVLRMGTLTAVSVD